MKLLMIKLLMQLIRCAAFNNANHRLKGTLATARSPEPTVGLIKMKDQGFRKIGNWYLDEDGKVDMDLPPSLHSVPGVIAFVINNSPVFFSSTKHYGPRLKDFKHSINGQDTKARIHQKLKENLLKHRVIEVWLFDSSNYRKDKNFFLKKYNSPWNII